MRIEVELCEECVYESSIARFGLAKAEYCVDCRIRIADAIEAAKGALQADGDTGEAA